MVFEHSNYRSFLRAALADRVAENENYSLRAFAEKLGFANSYLSEVLSAKKPLSTDAALRIAVKLGLTEAESQFFCLLVQLDSEKDPEYRATLNDRLKSIRADQSVFDLSSEMFRVISDWYHFAILELTHLTGFKLTPDSASKKLGIAKIEAESAIERLIQLELLERAPDGKLKKSSDYVLANSAVPNAAIKKFHRQLLEKASTAIMERTPDERISSSHVIPVDSRSLEEIRKITAECTSKILQVSKRSKVKDQVYCLAVHFFNLTQEKK